MAVIVFFALPYVARSWSILERSRETSGLPFVYLLKTLIPLFALLMALQGISQAMRAARLLSLAPRHLRSARWRRVEAMAAPEILAVLMVVAVCMALVCRLSGGAHACRRIACLRLHRASLGAMNFALLGALPQRMFGVMTNEVLLAIPLFIFMGVMLERSQIAEELLETMGRLFGSLPGGLGISVLLVGVLLAAAKGVVGATTVTIGLIMLPSMLRHGYDPRLASGTVAATATLAQIFPPATVLVLLGDQMSNAYQSAQLSQGIFAPLSVTVSDLFAGAIIPGFALVALYLIYLIAVAVFRP